MLALDPPHVSAYALTVEAGTPLADDPDRHPDDDDQADKYLLACDAAARRPASQWYEISNWARPGHECRHNLLYWEPGRLPRVRLRRPLPPAGPPLVEPAHARALHRRRDAGEPTEAAGEELDDETRAAEAPAARRCGRRAGVPADALDRADVAELVGLVDAPAATAGC